MMPLGTIYLENATPNMIYLVLVTIYIFVKGSEAADSFLSFFCRTL